MKTESKIVNAELEKTPPPAGEIRPVRRTRVVVVRIAVLTGVLLASLATVMIVVPWLIYRHEHVVVSQAVIQGTVTKLGARIDGQVKQVLAEAGQRVVKGQVVLRLEDQHLQAALQRAQAEVESWTQDVQSERLAIAHERRRLALEVERADSLRQSAAAEHQGEQSNLEKLDKEYGRVTALIAAGVAASSDLDRITGDRGKAQAAVRAAKAMLDSAEVSYRTAKLMLDGLQVRESRLAVLQFQVAMARARVAAAEADLAATVIRAPEDGWVVERIIEAGGSAKVGEPMLSLWIGRPWVEAWASEKDLDRFSIGSVVDVSLDAFPGRTSRGRVEALGLLKSKELQDRTVPSTLNRFIRKDSMVPVRIALEEENARLQPGLSAVVGIAKKGEPKSLLDTFLISRSLSGAPAITLSK